MRDLKELRKARGLTIRELEDHAGVSYCFCARLEQGRANPDNVTLGNAHKVAVVLGVSLDEFYASAKATEPNHKVGSPLMVKGQKQEWRKKKND